MASRKVTRVLLGAGATALVGAGLPLADVAIDCERSRARIVAECGAADSAARADCPIPTSEQCVWGKSLLPISIVVSVLFLGLPAGGLAYWFAGRRA